MATVAQAHGINANQLFSWRKLEEAGQLESVAASSSRELGAPARLLPVTVDEVVERQGPVKAASSAGTASCGVEARSLIELTLARGQVRIEGSVDATTLRTVLRCLLA